MTQQLLIFDLEIYDHHPGYIRHLLRYWPDQQTHLYFVISPVLKVRQPDVVQTVRRAHVNRARVIQIALKQKRVI